MLSAQETAKRLGVGELTLKEWVDGNKIQCTYAEGQMCFEEQEVSAFTERTGIRLITPEEHTAAFEKAMADLAAKNNTLSPEQIAELVNKNNS